MKKRVFSAEFKAERVLEVLQGEKELNQIASAREIAPNQLRNWKNEFLANAKTVIFIYDEDSLPPIGLGYIATNIQNSGIEVELLDAFANNISVSEVLTIVENKKPKFVALNVLSTNYEIVKEIVEECNFVTNFIIGGPVSSEYNLLSMKLIILTS